MTTEIALEPLTYEFRVTSAAILMDQSAEDFVSFTWISTYEVPVCLVVQPFFQFALTILLDLPGRLDLFMMTQCDPTHLHVCISV
jgi:hypothetical protein